MADFRLRVTYRMAGRLVMLSHLETARALERIVRRADLPYAVSQGFSPHMKMAFGAALPVGVGGDEEIFDVQLDEYVAPDRALARLQAASCADLIPLAARYIAKDVAAASVAYPFSTYRAQLALDGANGDAAALAAAIAACRVPEEITVVRKKKEKTLVVSEFLTDEMTRDVDAVTFTLEAKKTGSLRPDVLLDAMLEGTGLRIVSVMRIRQEENVRS